MNKYGAPSVGMKVTIKKMSIFYKYLSSGAPSPLSGGGYYEI
jgi:hypothetical protein